MNLYLNALGFSNIKTRKQIGELIKSVTVNPDRRFIFGGGDSDVRFEFFKEFGDDFGLVARGGIDEYENHVVDNCHVYAYSRLKLPCKNPDIIGDSSEYTVGYKDESNGNEFIFRLQNTVDYLNSEKCEETSGINFVALSVKAAVVLPAAKDESGRIYKINEDPSLLKLEDLLKDFKMIRDSVERLNCDLCGRDDTNDLSYGGVDCGESELDEELILESLRKSVFENDVLTIVDAYIIPEPSCVTLYSILAEITGVETLKNNSTGESIYRLLLSIEGTSFEVLINFSDLTGLPMVGMRFMGYCYLQGRVFF